MKKEYSFDELFHKAASYCSISEHCISDVEEKLVAWKVPEQQRKKLINKLLEEDFINENRYALAFVRDKFRFNKWGKIKIELSLKAKGLNPEIIQMALSAIDEGEYQEMLASILKSKLATLEYEYEYEKQGKLFRFAQSRGFEISAIDRALRLMNETL
ncbi:MAG TPA: regulatory protein RecX [Paludibacteraceae bacterium]|jgi:regulatory protein|nr:RecX family transcriptional regulator [Paludibacteraceae bacterium]MDS1032936.1 regulatory protein RecX [Porphyromonadaceae sp. NP-X]NLJ19948.1 RecX family transcriptional regulator [Bacteroidales bacterium]HOH55712.1 regulatory protein RecX [Paludibacteraceae bacterium]